MTCSGQKRVRVRWAGGHCASVWHQGLSVWNTRPTTLLLPGPNQRAGSLAQLPSWERNFSPDPPVNEKKETNPKHGNKQERWLTRRTSGMGLRLGCPRSKPLLPVRAGCLAGGGGGAGSGRAAVCMTLPRPVGSQWWPAGVADPCLRPSWQGLHLAAGLLPSVPWPETGTRAGAGLGPGWGGAGRRMAWHSPLLLPTWKVGAPFGSQAGKGGAMVWGHRFGWGRFSPQKKLQ